MDYTMDEIFQGKCQVNDNGEKIDYSSRDSKDYKRIKKVSNLEKRLRTLEDKVSDKDEEVEQGETKRKIKNKKHKGQSRKHFKKKETTDSTD